MRHAANELNFQVEDNCVEGLALKNYLVKHLSLEDTRTFGICFGIKTRKKSEVFSSILIRRRYLINFLGIKSFRVYDILCAKDFNPNERTGEIFSKGNQLILLPEQLRRATIKFSNYRRSANESHTPMDVPKHEKQEKAQEIYLYQCPDCFSVYDEREGEAENNIAAGTLFKNLPENYKCSICETAKEKFNKIPKSLLGLQTV